jgi:phosphoglycolate/pyridoxal phosphate phosphatase family enzyme
MFNILTSLFHSTKANNVVKLSSCQKFVDNIDIFIFDCDGVFWRGQQVIDRANDVLNHLKILNKKVYFITNNSRKSRSGMLKHFHELGLMNVELSQILTSSYAAAWYLQSKGFGSNSKLDTNKKVYVIGQEGLCEEFDLFSIPHIGGPSDNNRIVNLSTETEIDYDRNVGAVVVGLDTNINYYKIQYAQLCINEINDCLFIATNKDSVGNLTAKQIWAGGGAMVGAIEGCTGKVPIVVGRKG